MKEERNKLYGYKSIYTHEHVETIKLLKSILKSKINKRRTILLDEPNDENERIITVSEAQRRAYLALKDVLKDDNGTLTENECVGSGIRKSTLKSLVKLKLINVDNKGVVTLYKVDKERNDKVGKILINIGI